MGLWSRLQDWLSLENRDLDGGMDKPEGATRLFFATDVHGSTVCWRKFLNAEEFYSADVLILGGDTTGKAVMPIVDEGDRYWYTEDGTTRYLDDEEALQNQMDVLANRGYYAHVMDEAEYEALREAADSQERQDEIFLEEMERRIEEWAAMAEERVSDDVPIFVCPGNDDPLEIDDVWRESDAVTFGEGEAYPIDDHYEMVSCGWTNPTPWDTTREEPEGELQDRLERMVGKLSDTDRAIFNFHVPPFNSELDDAPELDEDLRPKFGGQTTEPVGSRAVREVIEAYQPPLSLHGHIHESRGDVTIGETIAVNPGSVYSEGSLQGAIIDLHPEVEVVALVRG